MKRGIFCFSFTEQFLHNQSCFIVPIRSFHRPVLDVRTPPKPIWNPKIGGLGDFSLFQTSNFAGSMSVFGGVLVNPWPQTAICSQGSEDLHHAIIQGGATKHPEPLHANVGVAQRRKEGLEPQRGQTIKKYMSQSSGRPRH